MFEAVLYCLTRAGENPPLKGLAGVDSTQSVLYFVETFLHAMIFGSESNSNDTFHMINNYVYRAQSH